MFREKEYGAIEGVGYSPSPMGVWRRCPQKKILKFGNKY